MNHWDGLNLYFAPLHIPDLLLSLGAGTVCVLWFDVVKRFRHVGTTAPKQPVSKP